MLSAPTAPSMLGRRVPQLLAGLVVMGIGVAMTVLAELGLGPWDVLHQGLADRTGLPIGTVGIVVGAAVLVAWIPLRERVGVGTLVNTILVGLVIDAVLAVVDPPTGLAARIALLLVGTMLIGAGAGFYIGAGLGPGPRDGLMTGIHRIFGWRIWAVRTVLEALVLVIGWALGGTVGIGTLVVAVGLGPIVHVALHRSALDPIRPADDDPRLGPLGE